MVISCVICKDHVTMYHATMAESRIDIIHTMTLCKYGCMVAALLYIVTTVASPIPHGSLDSQHKRNLICVVLPLRIQFIEEGIHHRKR